MADVAVVTDSTAALPAALVESVDLTVVSLYYDIEGSASPDGRPRGARSRGAGDGV